MRWGVYISGPDLVGWMLMRDHAPESWLLFDNEETAIREAEAIQSKRPYHFVRARPYAQGDEALAMLCDGIQGL